MMNFTSSSNNHRHPVLRAGLKGSSFSTSFIVKPDLVSLVNHNNHHHHLNNNNINNSLQSSGTNSFLTISKSRIPDIQMINKYYGLVPKKFVFNTRSDYSSKQSTKLQRARTAQSFNEDSTSPFTDGLMLTQNKLKEFHDSQLHFKHRRGSIDEKELQKVLSSGGGGSGGDEDGPTDKEVELVAKKIQVEKHKKWRRIKDCGRSLSMMENCENMMGSYPTPTPNKGGSNNYKDSQPDIQRVIKIDLNNMRWEESYKPKLTNQIDTIHGGGGGDRSGSSPDSSSASQSPQLVHANGNIPDRTEMDGGNGATKNVSNSNNTNQNPSSASRRKGFLRKTTSFDEQLVKWSGSGDNSTSVGQSDKEVEITKPIRRPVTASARPSVNPNSPSSIQSQSNPGRIPPWTNRVVGQSDRRARFQKSFSVYSESMDGGAESESEYFFESNNNNSSSSILANSTRYRESKKSLHVQPPPEEISTMISLMSPAPDKDEEEGSLQNEIDKVALILNNMHNKMAQVEDRKLVKEEEEEEKEEKVPSMSNSNHPEINPVHNKLGCELEEMRNPIIQSDKESSFPVIDPASTLLSSDLLPVTSSGRSRRPPLVKAASISCENELFPPSSSKEIQDGNNGVKRIRPQTSKGRGTVSFSNTTSTRLIPSRSITSQFNSTSSYPSSSVSRLDSNPSAAGPASLATESIQSQASKNRKILIKKALIEINQSSINLGKKFSHRPKTAPSLDVNNKKMGSNSISQKRQPLKASSPPIKIPTVLRKNSTLNGKMDTKNSSSKEASPEPEPEPSPPKVRVLPRQSSFNSNSELIPGFPSLELNGESNGDDISKDSPGSFLHSKKREECLRIYEKMMKKGCAVKLETIFRGMMTPSEYAKNLAYEAEVEKNLNTTNDSIENINPGEGRDAGVSKFSEEKDE